MLLTMHTTVYDVIDDLRSYEGDQLLSRLHIKEVTDDDYRGSYECWMVNQNGYANTTLVRFVPGSMIYTVFIIIIILFRSYIST